MRFSPQQDKALKAVSAWMAAPAMQVFRLFGYAGTGKTTLAKELAEGVDGEVLFAAFTGKAAQVLRSRGCTNARTIHSLIYRPKTDDDEEEDGDESPSFALRRTSPVADAALVIIDECSMVDGALGRDLLSFGTPVLVLGDPGQLPPISGGGFFTDAEPDAMLTEIHRQAADNPIIALSRAVREGERLERGTYGRSRVISRRDVDSETVLDADQVLVGTNRTRRRYNARLRELKGFEGELPRVGDKLVCLRNNADKGLLNGSLWRVAELRGSKGRALAMRVEPEDEGPVRGARVRVLPESFAENGPEVAWAQRRAFDDFAYGYALTVHKAQGSQWDDVVLFDESFAFKEHRERWLYTAITRAAERITVVR